MQKRIQSHAAIHPVMLSGGSGTRLWPLSRAMYPKQFIRLLDNQPSSLLAGTLRRLAGAEGVVEPIIVCNNDHRFLVGEEAVRAGVPPRLIVVEPVARNTAPAVTVAALLVARRDPEGIIAVMPSDHVIADAAQLVAAMARAAKLAATGKHVLFGLKPGGPHAGYGYIKREALLEGFADAYAVEAFTEKPDTRTAEDYLAAGTWYWNSGIFVLGARASR